MAYHVLSAPECALSVMSLDAYSVSSTPGLTLELQAALGVMARPC